METVLESVLRFVVKSKIEVESIFKLNKKGKELKKGNIKEQLSNVILESECLRKGNFKLTSGILRKQLSLRLKQ